MTTAEMWRVTDRLLPLGDAADGAWIAERAVRALLTEAASGVWGVVPKRPRFTLVGEAADGAGRGHAGGAANHAPGEATTADDTTTAGEAADASAGGGPGRAADEAGGAGGRPATASGLAPDSPFPVPPGGLPPGPLRVTLDFAAVAGRPLPQLAARLRGALLDVAERALGLTVAEVDLRVTELLDAPPKPADTTGPPGRTSPPAPDDPGALAALAVPGVAALTDAFGAPLRRDAAGRLRIEVAVTAGHRAVDVARAVRTAVTAAAPGATTVTVLVSEVR
ncbi:hypothetical protein ACFYU9_31470 [Streptomyces sp. NPDC004327]|uniref:hypothetical protein n=1 Tax=Streptomyces sp. NPDC004327 TaxID=3364699 RepID=UPI0036A8EA86